MNTEKKLIGSGRIAQVYLEDGFAFKTFKSAYSDKGIEYEVNLLNTIYNETDLLVPHGVFDREKHAIKMDYINGLTLDQRIHQEKYKFPLEDMIDTQLSVYQYQGLKIASAHEEFKLTIENSDLADSIKEKALISLNNIPVKDNLCHFDIHFLNIMYQEPNYYIIDWVNAKLGNPVMDIARSHIILKQYAKRVANKYLKIIAKKGGFSLEEIHTAIPLMAALRILENEDEAFKEQLLLLID